MNNVCVSCNKKFECNGGCAKINKDSKPFDKGLCCCPECAQKARMKNLYAYRNLLTICSRFLEEKEKVLFT
jgi:hypothetical protein